MAWGLFIVTVAILGSIAFGAAGLAEIKNIQNNWDKRRCDLIIMLLSVFLKPEDDPRSASQFATDNFAFCQSQLSKDVLRLMMMPLVKILMGVLSAVQGMGSVLNGTRTMLAGAAESFQKLLQQRQRTFQAVQMAVGYSSYRMNSIMGRMVATVYSVVYAGMSAFIAFLNLKDYILKIVMIIIGILMAIVIFLFLFLAPTIPLIIAVIVALTSMGVAMGGAASAFCVEPKALVKMEDDTLKYLFELKIGDRLASQNETPNLVTGILHAKSDTIPLVSLYGVKMSGSRRVYYKDACILAQEHPDATPIEEKLPYLICLNTTTHSVPIISQKNILWVSDWQEMEDEEDKYWYFMVNDMLNQKSHPLQSIPTSTPLHDQNAKVYVKDHGWTHAYEVPMGAYIRDRLQHYTQVEGIYYGNLTSYIKQLKPGWVSDGTWVLHDKIWKYMMHSHHHYKKGNILHPGCILVTKSGTYDILYDKQTITIRDFTEVGMDNIEKTYKMIDRLLQSKQATKKVNLQ